MTVWIDADSCPQLIRPIIAKAGLRLGLAVVFVANCAIPVPNVATPGETQQPQPPVRLVTIDRAATTVDDVLVQRVGPGDIVITRDIPLAARLIEPTRNPPVIVLNDRGSVFDPATIRERLSQRDAMAHLRDVGLAAAGGRRYGRREAQAFANALDRVLTATRAAIE